MRGIGEELTPLALPPFWLVLVNPGVPVPTPAVFAALARRDNPPMPEPLDFADAEALAAWLAARRNDLEPPAAALVPAVGAVLAALAAQPACRLARMSGSGATCFGFFTRGRARPRRRRGPPPRPPRLVDRSRPRRALGPAPQRRLVLLARVDPGARRRAPVSFFQNGARLFR